jgi:competence ComEA-like helix-hairpin-helix protein
MHCGWRLGAVGDAIRYRSNGGSEPVPEPDPGPLQMPRGAQPLVAAGVACALAAMAAWFVTAGGLAGRLVHHDAPPAATTRFTVDLNAAGAAELAQLPGLGPATAARIVEHRRDRGRFASVEALLDVPGIGPTTLDRLRPHIRPIRPTPPGR